MKIFLSTILLLNIIVAQTINISVDKNKLQEGDIIQFIVEVSGAKNFPQIELDKLKDNFDFIGGPYEQTSIEFINGNMNETKTLKWTLSPKTSGNITIPALQGSLDGKNFVSKPIRIEVSKDAKHNDNSVFIIAELDKENAYLGEQITVTYKLYKDIDTRISGIDQFQMPDFNGFWVEEIFSPQRLQYQNKNVIYDGRKYQVANLGQRALFPIPSDQHLIPSVRVKTQIEQKKKKKRRRDPFFDPFFDSFFAETQTKFIKSDPKIITIDQFPEPKPSDFYGAVGEFEISSIIDQNEILVNEGILFTVSLKGTGNLGLFSIPKVQFPDDIEAFPPNDDFKRDVFRNKITGSQKLEYVLIPRKPGQFEIPAIQMSYFNPKKQNWVRTKTNSIKIVVKGDNKNESKVSGLTKKEIEMIGEDIRFIKMEPYGENIFINNHRTLAYVFYLISLMIFFTPIFMSKIIKYNLFSANDRQMKNALKKSQKMLKTKNVDSFSIASKAIYVFLQDRLLLPTKNLDPNSAYEILEDRLPQNLLNELIEILKTCDAGNYSPLSRAEKDSIISKTNSILNKLNKNLK